MVSGVDSSEESTSIAKRGFSLSFSMSGRGKDLGCGLGIERERDGMGWDSIGGCTRVVYA